MKKHLCLLLSALLLAACTPRVAQDECDALPPIFPDYTDVTVPTNIAPPNFGIPDASHLEVTLHNSRGEHYTTSGSDAIDISLSDWHRLTREADSISVGVSVWDDEHPEGIRYRDFSIHLAPDSIDPWICYRLIPPGYEGWKYMGIYQRHLTSWDEETLIENSQANNGCVNCHSFANYDTHCFTMHVRGKGGGTVVLRDGNLEKVDIKSMGPGRHGSYNVWHPSGRYIAFSSNSTHQSFYGRSQDKIEVYDLWSDLIVYDIENHRVISDERFLDTLNMEIFPSFSPDGRWMYFSTAHPVRMPQEVDQLKYSIVRVPFDPTNGTLGEVDTLYSAYQRGGTALMPRISPDGRWMLYSTADCGAFNLYHIESDLEMMDLQTGDTIDCSPINSSQMESYHAWSSNGRWLIFASKRLDTRYTRLFIAHWDGTRWHKPFLLPQRRPFQNTQLMMAYNIPEFIKRPLLLDPDRLADLFQIDE